MKILIMVMCAIFLLIGSAYAEDIATEYTCKTKDYEVDEIGDVIIIEKTVSSIEVPWTLNEIDIYIMMNQDKIKTYQRNIDALKKIREKVEAEAMKIKVNGVKKKES